MAPAPHAATPTGRPTDEELSRRILDVGLDLLHEHGYAALRVEHVAKAAACGKAAIYRRHADKAALVAAIVLAHAEIGECPDTGSVREDLLEHALQNQRNQEGKGVAAGRAMSAILEPEVFALVWDSLFLVRRRHGERILDRAITRGELPSDVDPDVILDAVSGLTLLRHAIEGVRVEPRQYLALIDALLTSPPRLPHASEGTD